MRKPLTKPPPEVQTQVATELARFTDAKQLLSKIVPVGGEPKNLDYLTTARNYPAAYQPINRAADALERLFVLGFEYPSVIQKYTDEFRKTREEWQKIFLSRIRLDPNFIIALREITAPSIDDFLNAFEKTL